MSQPIGWDVFQSETSDDSEFELWGVATESKPQKVVKEEIPTENLKRVSSSCPKGHTWIAEERIHNKGKGKYQWYICDTCNKRQRRPITRRRNRKKK